ncbi:MAG: hypothetical protein HY741_23760 [Chloroflexi bacterium]|nr:hypothetical protein [Chloroflexota bacterium]
MAIELIRALFPKGEDVLPPLFNDTARAWVLNLLGGAYMVTGRPRDAISLVEKHNSIARKGFTSSLFFRDRAYRNLARGLVNLASCQIYVGDLTEAKHNLQWANDLLHVLNDKSDSAMGHQEIGLFFPYTGEFMQAHEELKVASDIFDSIGQDKVSTGSQVSAYRAQLFLLMDNASSAINAAKIAQSWAMEWAKSGTPIERDFVQASWLIGASLVAQICKAPVVAVENENRIFLEAESNLTEALARDRRANLVEFEAPILLEFAKLRMAQARLQSTEPKQPAAVIGHVDTVSSRTDEALQFANEALSIADRCEYRLQQAEIHNFLAEWHWQRAQWVKGEVFLPLRGALQQKAREHAERAKERAWCDGPPYSYKVAYERAEELLKTIQ